VSASVRRHPGLGAFVLLAVAVALLVRGCGDDEAERHAGGGGGGGGGGQSAGGERVQAEVLRAVDGDTIEVLLDGAEEDVRYIGVDTPESVAPGQPVECYGEAASEFNAELVEGEDVTLVFDAELRDRYGRLLAYVYVGELLVNAELLEQGFARTLEIEPNTSKAPRFARLARRAGAAGLGLWGACQA
jgi:micrococcal nuclease